MLNRRILRIKVFQALYSYNQTQEISVNIAEKNLFTSIQKMHELFIWNLAILTKLSELSDERLEINKQKFIKSDQDNESLRKFSENSLIINLTNNQHFNKLISSYKVNWSSEQELLKKIIRKIENSELYKNYRNLIEFSIESDIEFLKTIYESYVYKELDVVSSFEEKNMHWSQDQYYIGILVSGFIKNQLANLESTNQIPDIFKKNEIEEIESDEVFVKNLFTYTIEFGSETEKDIVTFIENWEPERVALSDMIIMKMAATEILKFNQIPIKSSLNEYIELAKLFSTPKSKIFINGILDKLISYYQRNNKFEKVGRGLKEN